MFEELNNNLSVIEGEMSKLRTAVTHIQQAKEAALKAVNVAETTNKEFKDHLLKVTKAVDAILKPHEELISVTQTLNNTIKAVDFPKQLKQMKVIMIAVGVVVIVSTILILALCHR